MKLTSIRIAAKDCDRVEQLSRELAWPLALGTALANGHVQAWVAPVVLAALTERGLAYETA